jgi:hypothetical protein
MNDGFTFLLGFVLTVSVAFSVVRYMGRHLKRMLVEICGGEGRAGFWTVFANVAVIIIPSIIALSKIPTGKAPLLAEIAGQLKWSMSALILSVLLVGFVLSRFASGKQPRRPAEESRETTFHSPVTRGIVAPEL